jgi:hypothetical protein
MSVAMLVAQLGMLMVVERAARSAPRRAGGKVGWMAARTENTLAELMAAQKAEAKALWMAATMADKKVVEKVVELAVSSVDDSVDQMVGLMAASWAVELVAATAGL